jgi:1-deoxy-D-xylulose-5-phosphate synthase
MIWALGPMVQEALKLAARLAAEEKISVGVVNARFVKPLDRTLLLSHAACIPLIVTLEDHVVSGGFGSAVLETLHEADCVTPVERIGWPDKFIEHGTNVEILRAAHGLSTDDILRRIKDRARHLGIAGIRAAV